jgi:hypothetical protein
MRGLAALNGMMRNLPRNEPQAACLVDAEPRAARLGASRPRWFDTTMQLGQFVDHRHSRSNVAAG